MTVLTFWIPVNFYVFLHSAYVSRRPRPHDYTVEAQLGIKTALPFPVYCEGTAPNVEIPKDELQLVLTWEGRTYKVTIPDVEQLEEAKRLYAEGKRGRVRTIVNRIARYITNVLYESMPQRERLPKRTIYANVRAVLYYWVSEGREHLGVFKIQSATIKKYVRLPKPLKDLDPKTVNEFNTVVLNTIWEVLESWFEAPTYDSGLEWEHPIINEEEGYSVGMDVSPECYAVLESAPIDDVTVIERWTRVIGASYSKSNAYEITAPEHPYWTDRLEEYADNHLDMIINAIIDAYITHILPKLEEVGRV